MLIILKNLYFQLDILERTITRIIEVYEKSLYLLAQITNWTKNKEGKSTFVSTLNGNKDRIGDLLSPNMFIIKCINVDEKHEHNRINLKLYIKCIRQVPSM